MSDRHCTHRTNGNKPFMQSSNNNHLSAINNNFGGMNYNHAPRLSEDTANTSNVSYLANHLKYTANLGEYCEDDQYGDENRSAGKYNRASIASRKSALNDGRFSLEDNYSRAMNRMNRGGFDPSRTEKQSIDKSSRSSREGSRHSRDRSHISHDEQEPRRESTTSETATRINTERLENMRKAMKKKSVSSRDPSEETIAIFGAYGVTGHYFLQRAMDAGYKVRALLLPGMVMDDVAGNPNVNLITGSLEEVDKIAEVVMGASYVVCLLNGCDQGTLPLPVENDGGEGQEKADQSFFNLNFMHNLLPIVERSSKCRVLLYEASSLAKDDKGNAPFFTKMVKMVNKMAFRTDWRAVKKEQDKIVQYIANKTKYAPFNYIVTRPSDSMIWDKPSRKKLAASRSQPGPFPITNTDLADFTLSALRTEKLYNSCPYVVQDGI